MKIIGKTEKKGLASVYLADFGEGRQAEFVESLQPPHPRSDKWVLIVSTLFGCPVKCRICDAGNDFKGKLTREQMFRQIDYLVSRYYPSGRIPSKKFKIQFARMGEPAFNQAVLDVLEELPVRYDAPGLIPSISSIAPACCENFFDRLLSIKEKLYEKGRFQLQFSLHSTNELERNALIPARTWSFSEIAGYGERFYRTGDRKITLNFALAKGSSFDPVELLPYFSPEKFLLKLTPLNPTYKARENQLSSRISASDTTELTDLASSAGYESILSFGEFEENLIGSNCGQYLRTHLEKNGDYSDSYTYELEEGVDSLKDDPYLK
ncbi:MAG: radical SAM protein [Candidatus Wallbacteria bacterium]|nr:radical SAM protein [Candidatus Wallbacteria bacterium]